MTDGEFWEVERGLWLGGAAVFRRWVSPDCLMVFPDPAGMMDGASVIEVVGTSPRWERADLTERLLRRIGEAAAVLAYRVEAIRSGLTHHRALCSSTYVAEAGAWWLVQHQQTPSA